MADYATFYDVLRTQNGWLYTEDIPFFLTKSMTINLVAGTVVSIPIKFTNFPILSLNQHPGAIEAYLVLRRLAINARRFIPQRYLDWDWIPAVEKPVVYLASTTSTITVSFSAGTGPTGDTLAKFVPIALRRMQFNAQPAGVTINKVEVKAGWSGTFDDLNITAFTGLTIINLTDFYDAKNGIINRFVTSGSTPTIDIRITYTNTGAQANSTWHIYGMQQGIDWAQWTVQYQDWQQIVHNIGGYDDIQTPTKEFILDRLIPVAITDNGQVNTQNSWGNLLFTMNASLPYYLLTAQYDIMLNASIAYKMPVGQ